MALDAPGRTDGRIPARCSASSCAEPMCSMFRDPRREDHTTWTAVAPDAVFHRANVRHPTRLRADPKAHPLVRKSHARHQQTSRPQGYGPPDPAPVIRVRIVYYLTSEGTAPALEFLDTCPSTIDAQFTAVLDTVAAAPPPRFSGGGKWEAIHGTMGGWYEIRLTGPRREQFRLFCLLENGTSEEIAKRGLPRPAIAVITGMRKPWRTTFSDRDYKRVRDFGTEHQRNYPRRVAA